MAGREDLSPNVRSLLSLPRILSLIHYSVVEINTGLICGCTPVLKAFFRHILSKKLSDQPQQQQICVRPGSIWMGKHPDDRTRCNYREFIELEGGNSTSDELEPT